MMKTSFKGALCILLAMFITSANAKLKKPVPGTWPNGETIDSWFADTTKVDINTLGKSKRGAERLVFDDRGNIYYTDDHYETFTLLYGGE